MGRAEQLVRERGLCGGVLSHAPQALGDRRKARRRARVRPPRRVSAVLGLEEDKRGGFDRAAECDQLARLREINLSVVRHLCGTRRVKAEADELIEPPNSRLALRLGRFRLEFRLDLLDLFHTAQDRPAGLDSPWAVRLI